jgi:Ni,Fe-hydrogenase III large subunit
LNLDRYFSRGGAKEILSVKKIFQSVVSYYSKAMNRIAAVQECDARMMKRITEAGYIKEKIKINIDTIS